MPGTRTRTLTSALPLALAVVGILATAVPAAQAEPDRVARTTAVRPGAEGRAWTPPPISATDPTW